MKHDRITFDPSVMGGRACVRGMSIPVSTLVGQIAHGASFEEILREYPDLERDDIRHALAYAASLAHGRGTPVTAEAIGDSRDRIVVDPRVLVGKPVIKGTRIAVEFVIDLLARGYSREQIRDEYDHIADADIGACLAYAADLLKSGVNAQ